MHLNTTKNNKFLTILYDLTIEYTSRYDNIGLCHWMYVYNKSDNMRLSFNLSSPGGRQDPLGLWWTVITYNIRRKGYLVSVGAGVSCNSLSKTSRSIPSSSV